MLHQNNQGVSFARLREIEAAAGAYIGFVDGDDLIDADMYERLYRNAVKYQADISHCGYRMVLADKAEFYYNTGRVIEQNRQKGLADLLEGTLVEPGLWNKLFRRDLFSHLLSGDTIMDMSLRENEDLLMNYCLFSSAERSVFEDFCPYQYIIRENSSSHGGMKPHILTDPIGIGELLLADTKADEALYPLSARYYVTKLIKAATVSGKNRSSDIAAVCRTARAKLCAFLPEYLSLRSESKKKKLLAVWAAYAPGLYGVVHRLYLHGS